MSMMESLELILDEVEMPAHESTRTQALRLFARWLVSAARNGAVGTASGPLAGPQNPLDVAAAPKVDSDCR